MTLASLRCPHTVKALCSPILGLAFMSDGTAQLPGFGPFRGRQSRLGKPPPGGDRSRSLAWLRSSFYGERGPEASHIPPPASASSWFGLGRQAVGSEMSLDFLLASGLHVEKAIP